RLAAAGFTRISLGMQSADPQVLHRLDRTHNPDNVARAVEFVRAAGMEVSLDLIYATPGESMASWLESLQVAIALAPDHLSAYALGIEPGTKLGAALARGEIPPVADYDAAEKYERADQLLHASGYRWYEVSNWARTAGDGSIKSCRHNLHYWRGDHWWGFGPGAHGHIGGVRWMNVKHPLGYAQLLTDGRLPVARREILDAKARHEEHVMLGIRLREGIDLPASVSPTRVSELVADGLLQREAAAQGRAILTLRGRLLADPVTYALLGI
ncbi:MAG: coproporphyrinogen-III oxidase family protein, partial [Bowdeniella nasicola]|nr:coproporphyrinogen-III oxidase family protein [Bowdeniella nasicola]